MEPDYEYYNSFSNSIIIPKLYFNLKLKKSIFFTCEWFEIVSYFKKVVTILDFYILKSLIKNYYSETNKFCSRSLITKIAKNLNYYLYNDVHYEYFLTFDDTIKRFNRLKELIVINSTLSTEKKKNFFNFIVSTISLLQEIIVIFEDYHIFYKKNEYYNDYFMSHKTIHANFIPFAGNDTIKSFWISDNCLTIYQFLKFVEDDGYKNKKYWSKEGYFWLNYFNYNYPKNWRKIDDEWYIGDEELKYFYNHPVSKISFYEAEACAKYYGCRLPTQEEWDWVSTNRNKTDNPFGLKLPFILNISTEFADVISCNDVESKSLMNVNQLYGNVWEFTKSIEIENDNLYVYTKGGDWKIPRFLLNNNLKLLLPKDNRNYSIGFRLVKL